MKPELSRDNGATWELIDAAAANTSSYIWLATAPARTPAAGPGLLALLKVTAQDAAGYPANDQSDAGFSLFDVSTPVVITRLEAQTADDGVAVRWAVADRSAYTRIDVERADAEAGPWLAVAVDRHDEGDLTVALDRTTSAGKHYWFRLVATDAKGASAIYGPVSGVAGAPKALSLSSVWPNPTRGAMRMEFAVPKEMPVSLVVVVDVQGRTVQVLAKGSFAAGRVPSELGRRDGPRRARGSRRTSCGSSPGAGDGEEVHFVAVRHGGPCRTGSPGCRPAPLFSPRASAQARNEPPGAAQYSAYSG